MQVDFEKNLSRAKVATKDGCPLCGGTVTYRGLVGLECRGRFDCPNYTDPTMPLTASATGGDWWWAAAHYIRHEGAKFERYWESVGEWQVEKPTDYRGESQEWKTTSRWRMRPTTPVPNGSMAWARGWVANGGKVERRPLVSGCVWVAEPDPAAFQGSQSDAYMDAAYEWRVA